LKRWLLATGYWLLGLLEAGSQEPEAF